MKKWIFSFPIILIATLCFVTISCSKEVSSKPQFIFKPAPDKTTAASIDGEKLTRAELFKGIENEVFEAEMKVHEIKMNRLRALLLEKFMSKEPARKGMSNDEFLEKHILKGMTVTQKEIQAFAKEKNIPKNAMNAAMEKRISNFLMMNKKKTAVNKWLAVKTKEHKVEVYLERPQRPVFEVKTENSPYAGGADAKVVIAEFTDFECPFCSKGSQIMVQLKKKYGNKIKVVFKNFPLPFHHNAKFAHHAAMCANDQGTKYFWKLYKVLFADQSKLSKDDVTKAAKSVGLDMTVFEQCNTSNKFADKISQDFKEGQDLGVNSTPTFFVNGQLVSGAQPVEVFSEIIDAELKK